MNWAIISTGFIFGTWKFMFAHWITFAAYSIDSLDDILQIFIASTVGAWTTMSVFYFASGYFMKRSAEKQIKAMEEARLKGEIYNPFPPTKTNASKFKRWLYWRLNRIIVWIKKHIGIYGVSMICPILLSVPLGTIVCVKFYGDQRKTFPLMLLGSTLYSFIMCFWIYLVS